MKRVLFLLWLLCLVPGLARGELVDGVVAIVGDEIILLSELSASAKMLQERIETQRGPLPPDVLGTLRREALQGLIDEKLIIKVAKRFGMTATEEEIDQAVAGIAKDEDVMVDRIYAAAASQGLDREQYREELGTQITRMKVITSSVQSRVTVSEDEVKALYDERYGSAEQGVRIRVRHILLAWPEEATPSDKQQLRGQAAEIHRAAMGETQFAMLAMQHSAAPSAGSGGITDLREEDVAPEIAEQVMGLEPGKISPPIETEHGVNLFQMVERFDPSEVSYTDARARLHAELIERKTMPEFARWLEELREGQYIEIIAPELR